MFKRDNNRNFKFVISHNLVYKLKFSKVIRVFNIVEKYVPVYQ